MARASTHDRLHRLDLLASRLKSEEPLCVGELAREFGVSHRTLSRDIALLRERGLPIEGPVDVLIDPGHGGEETGAVAPNGLVEAHVNLRVAEVLRDLLAERGYRVLLTRARDGMILYLPDTELLGEVRQHLFQSGVEDLDMVDKIQF